MGKVQWFFVVLVGSMFAGAAYAFGADPAPAATAGGLTALFAGAGGGWWKGALSGIGRGIYGFVTSTTADEDGGKKKFDVRKLITAGVAGGLAGVAAEMMGIPFDNATGYVASFGLTEIISKGVNWLWTRWAGDLVGEAVTRSMERAAARAAARQARSLKRS